MNISMVERRLPLMSLGHALVRLLVKRIKDDHAAMIAEGLMEDLGYDDCSVCVGNRRRTAWTVLSVTNDPAVRVS